MAPNTRNFDGYKVILAPGMMHMPSALKDALAQAKGQVVIGPRSAARDIDMSIPVPLPPDFPGVDVTVARVESIRPDTPLPLDHVGAICNYREILEGSAAVVLCAEDQTPVAMRHENITYLGAWLDQEGLRRLFRDICQSAGCPTVDLPDGVRRRQTGCERFWFNFDIVSNVFHRICKCVVDLVVSRGCSHLVHNAMCWINSSFRPNPIFRHFLWFHIYTPSRP